MIDRFVSWLFSLAVRLSALDAVSLIMWALLAIDVATFVMTWTLLYAGGEGIRSDIYGLWVGYLVFRHGGSWATYRTKRQTSFDGNAQADYAPEIPPQPRATPSYGPEPRT